METFQNYYNKFIEIINQRIIDLEEFINADYETKKVMIKTTLYKNRRFIFYMTIIAIVLAFLSLEYERSIYNCPNKSIKIQKGGEPLAGMTEQIKGVFGVVGEKLASAGNYMVERLQFIWYTIFAFMILGLIVVSPLFIYLFIVFIMFKFLVKGTMKI
jgi:hypothetical protein